MPDRPPLQEVSVYIEQEGTNKFKIQSDKLQEIGTQLRGRREFSAFHSVILPLIVSVATIIFSSAFQYVSWFNSVAVKYATDVADKAERTFENSAAAIGTRHYAVLVFLPSLRDLIHAKAKAAPLNAMAQSNDVSAQANAKKRNADAGASLARAMAQSNVRRANATRRAPDAENRLMSIVAQSTGDKKDDEITLHKSHLDIKQKRFASYYQQMKLWNENYDHLLSDIEYALDRPVFEHADKENEDFRI